MDNSSGNVCQETLPVVHYPPFTIIGVTHLTLVIITFFTTLPLLYGFLPKLTIHTNTKILLVMYFMTCFTYAVTMLFAQIHQHYLLITMILPCDVYLNLTIAFWIYRLYLYCLFMFSFSSGVVWIELSISTIFYQCYERCGQWLGILLLFISLAAPAFLVAQSIQSVDEMRPTFDYGLTQGDGPFTAQVMYITIILHNTTGLIATLAILYYNKKLKKSAQFRLSSRFQINANLLTVGILKRILIISCILNIIYGTSQALFRYYRFELFGDNFPLYLTFRKIALTTPIQAFSTPLVILWYLKGRSASIKVSIDALRTSNPKVATLTYQKFLSEQWRVKHYGT